MLACPSGQYYVLTPTFVVRLLNVRDNLLTLSFIQMHLCGSVNILKSFQPTFHTAKHSAPNQNWTLPLQDRKHGLDIEACRNREQASPTASEEALFGRS